MKTEPDWYPLRFRPIYRTALWGGDRIRRLYGRRDAPDRFCAESWELADRAGARSVIVNGPWRGRTLHDLVRRFPSDVVGRGHRGGRDFPLLIKIIDAHARLSVQVHPGPRAARRHGGHPKSEMWYVLKASTGAKVFAGFRPGYGRREIERAVREGGVAACLKAIPAIPGEAIYVPAGRVHAIGEGCLILEIQQNSDTTYRLYDWDRVDRDGKPRPLHVPQALDAIRWRLRDPVRVRPRRLGSRGSSAREWLLLAVRCFRAVRIQLDRPQTFSPDGRSFHILFVERGGVLASSKGGAADLAAGTTCLLPAAVESYRLSPQGRTATVIRISRGWATKGRA